MLPSARSVLLQQHHHDAHLIAAYSFDTYSGVDASEAGHTLTSGGAGVSYAAGKNGSAVFGGGTQASACLTSGVTMPHPAHVTFMGWVYVNSTQPGGWVCAFGLHQTTADWPIWGIYPTGNNSGLIVFGSNTRGGGSNLDWYPSSPIADSWHHIAGSFDGSAKRLFLDGQLVATQQLGATDAFDYTNVGDFHVLGDPTYGSSRMLAGGVDDVRIYNTPLTAAQVHVCMMTPVGTVADPLL